MYQRELQTRDGGAVHTVEKDTFNDDIEKKYEADLDFWKNSPLEGVGRETVVNLVNKFSEITILYECVLTTINVFLKTQAGSLNLAQGRGGHRV